MKVKAELDAILKTNIYHWRSRRSATPQTRFGSHDTSNAVLQIFWPEAMGR
jgi:hypothetical protein